MSLTIVVEQNKSLSQHMQAEINPGKVDLVIYDVVAVAEDKKELKERARVSYPAATSKDAYKILEHFRWAAGKCLKAINAKEADINQAIFLAQAVPAPVVVVDPAAPVEVLPPAVPVETPASDEDKELADMIAADEAEKNKN